MYKTKGTIQLQIIKGTDISYEYSFYDNNETKQDTFTAINNLNFEIEEGSFVAVLGHNGSGKSTLAKLINALILPSKGKMYLKGYDSSIEDNVFLIRQNAGMVFQNPDNQIVATIVEEDVAFGLENLGIEPNEIRKRVNESLKSVGMEEHKKATPSLLSGGQKQRIAIAGVLAMKPNCIILDEPTAMLDPGGRKEVIDTITRLNKEENITVILITHFMEEAVKADRVIVMHEGNIVLDGTPKEIFKQVDLMKEYSLEVPQVTEICYNLRKMGLDIKEDILSIQEMVGEICNFK